MFTLESGRSQESLPLWIRLIIHMLRIWLYVYDCLSNVLYGLFSPPIARLERSERIKARPMKNAGSPWCNVDGPVREDFPGKDTVDKLFTHAAKLYGDKAALGTRELLEVYEEEQPDGRVFEKWVMGKYKWESYTEIHDKIGRIASGLKNIVRNDCRAVIFAETRADWLITVLSLFRINVPVATVYATLGEKAIIQAMNETEATLLVTSAELLTKISRVRKKIPKLRWLVYFRPLQPVKKISNMDIIKEQFENVVSLDELKTYENKAPEVSPAKRDDTAMIMYTSGSTGTAKGVIITHYNMVSSVAGLGAGISIIRDTDTYIGYLPLAHILEVTAELTCLIRGCRIGYSNPSTLQDRGAKIKPGTYGDCWALKPTLMAIVPTIVDRIFKAVTDEILSSPPVVREVFRLAYERKRTRYQQGYYSSFLDRTVFKRTRCLLGGKLRGILSGGAALNPEIQCFMNICMCCPVIQGYGLTETCAAVSIADVNDLSTGSVGPPVRCSQILLREWSEGEYTPLNDPPRGEILVSGSNVSPGYWKEPEKTAEDFVIINGTRYFATGDIGEFRKDGSLCIIDRKKDLIKMQNGEYISLAKIETTLLSCPLIDNICCYGGQLSPYLIALIVPNRKHLEGIAVELHLHSVNWSELCRNTKIVKEYQKRLEEFAVKSNHLLKNELPRKIYLCDETWTAESGLLTEALKLKRRRIKEKYEKVIADLYHDDSS
ncbi:AMP-binding enzyme family protein [Brugia malayi]|uniref:long-chain-fatty-acid--CoA ligase n=1 Tax=Brugia malayi TaxID=6279 RepID=A0A4E9F6R4_BRUMA|nr:AMP-binding enzyme family protein [Brugia malayi]VIO92469.1 AMP-binding enzyme family protein [Brugia malayi]